MTAQETKFVAMTINILNIFPLVEYKIIPHTGMPTLHIEGIIPNMITGQKSFFKILFFASEYIIELMDNRNRVISQMSHKDSKGLLTFLDNATIKG